MEQLLIVSIPLLIFSITVIAIIFWMLKNERQRRHTELMAQNKAIVLPNRLQAYERMALYLERISPESMVIREQNNAVNSLVFHSILLKTIRSEFEHNVAMQIYVSPQTWRLVQTAKDEVIKLVNMSAKDTNPELPSIQMGRTILENAPSECNFHIKRALEAIQKDIQMLG